MVKAKPRAERSINWSKAASIGSVVVLIFGLGSAWANLNAKLDRLDDRIERIEVSSADTLCAQVVMRQVDAIEAERDDISERLQSLSSDYGCRKDFSLMAATEPAPFEQGDWLSVETNEKREDLERQLVEIDEQLYAASAP